jgi:hypothetical protein
MELIIDKRGAVRCIYSESIDLTVLGDLSIRRASCVEPDKQGRWWASLSPVNGPTLGPFNRRSQALAAEMEWLEASLFAAPTLKSTGGIP